MREHLRLPSPAPAPQGVAFDGGTLWMSSVVTHHLYAINAATWAAHDEMKAPGEPYGITVVGDDLYVVIGHGENSDDRYIYRFIPGHGFKSDRTECPDLSGAFLAFDGDELFLSQAWNKKILALDVDGRVVHEIPLTRRPVGMTIVDGCFYLVTSDDDFNNREFTKIDARGETTVVTTLAPFGFPARGLAYDGARFWTTHREANELVAFTVD